MNRKSGRRGRPPKAKRAHHKKALANPETLALAVALRKRWNKLAKLERGDRLLQLVESGCTRRGLADFLHQSPTTIRRHIEIAGLPETERDAITRGVSAKTTLIAREEKRRKDRLRDLQEAEKTDQSISDRAARVLADFLMGLRINETIAVGDLDRLFREVELKYRIGLACTEMERLSSRIMDPKKIILHCRPREIPKSSDRIWIDFYVEWLARIADSTTQVGWIRDAALKKAEKLATKEFKELPSPTIAYGRITS